MTIKTIGAALIAIATAFLYWAAQENQTTNHEDAGEDAGEDAPEP